jgi:hypothetical protein
MTIRSGWGSGGFFSEMPNSNNATILFFDKIVDNPMQTNMINTEINGVIMKL